LEAEKGLLQRVQGEFLKLPGPRHYVLGNHCVSALTKPEFLAIVGQTSSYYSFDLNRFHFVILDACFRSDSVAYERNNFNWTDSHVPQVELEWLRKDLQAATGPVLVFVHQCLDVEPPYGIRNAAEVRHLLEASGRVRAVFQGHHHAGGYRQINGIHYGTLRAMVEGPGQDSNAFAVVDALSNGQLCVNGFGKQTSDRWA
jgi:alkaline phosphatase